MTARGTVHAALVFAGAAVACIGRSQAAAPVCEAYVRNALPDGARAAYTGAAPSAARLGLQLAADSQTVPAGVLTVTTDDARYTAPVGTRVGTPDPRFLGVFDSTAFFVSLPAALHVRYVSFTPAGPPCEPLAVLTDRGAPSPTQSEDDALIAKTPRANILRAVFAAPFSPPLDCAKRYTDATALKVIPPDISMIDRSRIQSGSASGTALIRVAVASDGSVSAARVVRSTGDASLDARALNSAKQATYSPRTLDCAPIPGLYLFAVTFA
ncbi:MAG: energy transducer TonB [Candidatus Baltobacteraceae bacterium]